MNIIWVETERVGERMGHGVLFLDARPSAGRYDVIAVARGFAWLEFVEFVYVEILPPDSGHDIGFLSDARRTIEAFLRNPGELGVLPRVISPTLRILSNT